MVKVTDYYQGDRVFEPQPIPLLSSRELLNWLEREIATEKLDLFCSRSPRLSEHTELSPHAKELFCYKVVDRF